MLESIFVFSTGMIGLITIFQVLIHFKHRSINNIYLIVILSLLVLRFLAIGFFGFFDPEYLDAVLQNFNNILIIIVPFTFLYLKNLFFGHINFQKIDFVHFFLPFSFVVLDFLDDNQIITILFKDRIFLYFFLFYVVSYLIANYTIIHISLWGKKRLIDFSKKQNRLTKRWALFLLCFLFLTAIRLMLSLLTEVHTKNFNYGNSNIWISCIIWLFIFFKLSSNIKVLRGFIISSTQRQTLSTDENYCSNCKSTCVECF